MKLSHPPLLLQNVKLALTLALSLLFAAGAHARTWDLADVSVLFPLSEKMIGAKELLPFDVYRKHPVGFINEFGEDPVYRHLKVVGLRVDPIDRQVRLVWQPVAFDREEKALAAEDRAAHTFYQMSAKEFDAFLKEWTALADQVSPPRKGLSLPWEARGKPLNVHPAFADPKLGPVFATGIERLLRKYCGSRNLIQYTAMQLMSPDHTWWSFAGIERKRTESGQHAWRAIEIPRVKGGKIAGHYSENKIDFFNLEVELNPRSNEVTGMRGQFNFAYDDDTDLRPVFQAYQKPTEQDRPRFLSALPLVARFQNPSHTNPQNLDCVSCHVAQPVQFWMTESLSGIKLDRSQSGLWFRNPDPRRFDLRNPTIAAKSTRILRAFGYFGTQPAINQRVINETATVAHFLNTRAGQIR